MTRLWLWPRTAHQPTGRPANKAFESDQFLYLQDFISTVKGIGPMIGGSSPAKPYLGIATALCIVGAMATGVEQKTPARRIGQHGSNE